jgi:hypothetical protein
MQDIGKTNIRMSYEILGEYVPMVETGKRYNYAAIYLQNNLPLNVPILESLLELAEDSTLGPRLLLNKERQPCGCRVPGFG